VVGILLLYVVGPLLFLVLAVWVIVSLRTEPFSPEIREAGGPKGRSGDPAMPDKAMEEAVNGAQRRMVPSTGVLTAFAGWGAVPIGWRSS
jgi:hypothetical protein